MEWKIESREAKNGAKFEVATLIHEGREFTALGSIVDEAKGYLVGYVKRQEKGFVLTTFEGAFLCGLTRLSTWKTPCSFVSSTMSLWRCTFNGKRYSGRGAGEGMVLRLKVNKNGGKE